MLDNLKKYLAARSKDDDGTVVKTLADIMTEIASVGSALDKLLIRAEQVKAIATPQEAGMFEQEVQTLGALSREVWNAHGSLLVAARAYQQLMQTETQLAEAIKMNEQVRKA